MSRQHPTPEELARGTITDAEFELANHPNIVRRTMPIPWLPALVKLTQVPASLISAAKSLWPGSRVRVHITGEIEITTPDGATHVGSEEELTRAVDTAYHRTRADR